MAFPPPGRGTSPPSELGPRFLTTTRLHVTTLRALPQRRRDEAMRQVHDLLLLRQGLPDEELETNAQASLYNEDPSIKPNTCPWKCNCRAGPEAPAVAGDGAGRRDLLYLPRPQFKARAGLRLPRRQRRLRPPRVYLIEYQPSGTRKPRLVKAFTIA